MICSQLKATLSLFLMAAIALGAMAQENQLLVDDFETGDSAPDQWQTGANLQGVEYVYDQKTASSGTHSLSLLKTANRYFPIAQWHRTIPYQDGPGKLQARAKVKAKDATKATLDMIFLDESGNSLGHEWAIYIGAKNGGDPPANHDWKNLSGTVDVPKGTKSVMVALQIYGPGQVWFDDIEVTAGKMTSGQDNPEANEVTLKNMVTIQIGKASARYLGLPAKSKTIPEPGYGLLVVLPGGNGSADFHPFVSRILEQSAPDDFVLAQPLAQRWTDDQVVVWPTSKLQAKGMKYSTEQMIAAIIKDVGKKTKVDPKRVYLLGWSSGGPPVYASLLGKDSPVAGGIVAMSVFKPDLLPDPSGAADKSVYILHSPDDRTCPYWMAKKGFETLSDADVRTKLVDYDGGHGWHGDIFGNIKQGIEWLESDEDRMP